MEKIELVGRFRYMQLKNSTRDDAELDYTFTCDNHGSSWIGFTSVM